MTARWGWSSAKRTTPSSTDSTRAGTAGARWRICTRTASPGAGGAASQFSSPMATSPRINSSAVPTTTSRVCGRVPMTYSGSDRPPPSPLRCPTV